MVFIGLISYSLYLWHWPLVAFWKFLTFRQWNALDSLAIIAASISLATLSWKFIEQPFRGKQPLFPNRNRLFAVAGSVMTIAVATGGLIHLQKGMPGRIEYFCPDVARIVDNAENDPRWALHGEWEQQTEKIGEGVIPHVVGAEGATPTFALVGDSHARAMIPAMEQCAKRTGTAGYMIIKSSTPFMAGVQKGDACFDEVAHNSEVTAFIERNPDITTAILVARWGANIHGSWKEKTEGDGIPPILSDTQGDLPNDAPNKVVLALGLKRTVEVLLAMNRKVILVSDVPEIGYDVPRSYYMSARWPQLLDIDTVRPTVSEYNERQKEANAILEELAELPGVTLLRPETLMFDEQGKGRIMADGELLYVDDDHLSTAGALHVAPVFEDLFRSMGSELSAQSIVSVSAPEHKGLNSK